MNADKPEWMHVPKATRKTLWGLCNTIGQLCDLIDERDMAVNDVLSTARLIEKYKDGVRQLLGESEEWEPADGDWRMGCN